MLGFKVIAPGALSLLQDEGRFGQLRLGLTNGGPMDFESFYWAQRLCGNDSSATVIEVSVGGLALEALSETVIAITGADMPTTINGQSVSEWRSHKIKAGDRLQMGFAQCGLRAYLAVSGGFDVTPVFGSSATVVREGLGGLDGQALQEGQILSIRKAKRRNMLMLSKQHRPDLAKIAEEVELQLLPGYQCADFSADVRRLLFSSEFVVSNRSDRMGYCLNGPDVSSGLSGVLSEGICHGAVQVPPDGQPIVLLNDRQTIGGYPKLGSIISCDTFKLAQCKPGAVVRFAEIDPEQAHAKILAAHNERVGVELIVLDS
ncbi:MAG: biotin-dependent carboxyltransferase [Proteobacteria bacterium]|nr:biotin-dependent carboxyltransferase [Pseudomonadota bacterium]